MKLPDLLRREKRSRRDASALQAQAQDRAERLLVDGFRLLSRFCAQVADLVETQRLQRRGFEPQGKRLERLDGKEPSTGRR